MEIKSTPEPEKNDVETNKIIALLSYILFFLPLLAAKDSPFAMYHANQGLLLLLTAFASNLVLSIIPIIGWILLPFANLAILVFIILGILNALNGKMKPLPLIGGISILK
ncbi:Chloroplast import component protein (Tic20) [compost metagenome]